MKKTAQKIHNKTMKRAMHWSTTLNYFYFTKKQLLRYAILRWQRVKKSIVLHCILGGARNEREKKKETYVHRAFNL